MLQLWILVLSKRFLPMVPVLEINPTTLIQYTNRRHRGRSTTPRNQQHENFLQNDSLSFFFFFGIGTNSNGWNNKHPSRSYFGYPYNHWRLLKWLIPGNLGALRTKKFLEFPFLFLSSMNPLGSKKRSFARRLARDFL